MTELKNCPAINKACEYYKRQIDIYGDIVLAFCNHPENPDDCEGNTTKQFCPKRNPRMTKKGGMMEKDVDWDAVNWDAVDMAIKKATIKNCPFCGSEPELGLHGPLVDGEPRIAIWCVSGKCPMDDVGGNNFDTEEAAIKAWNTRADDTDEENKMTDACINPMNPVTTIKKIRACESEVAAQLLLEAYAKMRIDGKDNQV